MSLKNILKLAASFEVKLAQQAKIQVPYQQLQVMSGLLEQANAILNAKDYEQLMQYANPQKFQKPGFSLPGLPTYNTDQGKWTGPGSGQFFVDKNYPKDSTYLKSGYQNVLKLYNALIDGTARSGQNAGQEGWGWAYGIAEYLKNTNEWHDKIRGLQTVVEQQAKQPAQQAAPAAQPTAPRTWGA
jgi:hypothetical protein